MRVGVIGLGSVLMGDDALGPYVVRRLEAAWVFPPEVRVADLGTPGPEFIDYLRGLDAAIFIDTVKAEGAPGDLRLYRRPEILDAPPNLRLSPHDPNLREALLTAEFAGHAPTEVLLVGVIPERVELGTGLSPVLSAALDGVESAVLAELTRLGLAPARRDPPNEPEIWWE